VARGVRADLAGVTIGDGLPVAIMGVVNVSPESFHAGSVYRDGEAIVEAALGMVEAGASLIDVGARSTAPYLDTDIDDAEETARLGQAVERLVAKLPVPVSADTSRPGPATAALDAGARVINDVSTLGDPALAQVVAKHGAGLILMASPSALARLRTSASGRDRTVSPVRRVLAILSAGLRRARAARIPERRIVVDPGIGFFREAGVPWHQWDATVIAGLRVLREVRRPICVGVSRKSFIGAIANRPDTADRLAGSLAATAVAVGNGAALIRTHDVAQTRDAVRVAECLRSARVPRGGDR
jgi:dihydropteroate synthase